MSPLLNTKQAAELLGLRQQTLENWRCAGLGPAFVKLGRQVRYDPRELQSWIAAHTVK